MTEAELAMLEVCAKIAEEGIEEMESDHRSWREAFGDQCAQPYDNEITTRRTIAERIRALAHSSQNQGTPT